MVSIKYDLLGMPLELKKTHDFCAGEPKACVVMIHGIAADSSSYDKALKYLEGTRSLRDVRFVTFDLLGSGESYKSDKLDYNYKEQLEALGNSIEKLKLDVPLILVGHSMGTMIATRFATEHKKLVKQLILLSPPVYTEADLDNPAFNVAMNAFREAVSIKNRAILQEKSFNNSINHIVKNRKNYKRLRELTTPAVLIYGIEDGIIAPHNIPKVLKENPKYLSAIRTPGRHGISREKYSKMVTIIEEVINDKTI